jgi:hypothetical protein
MDGTVTDAISGFSKLDGWGIAGSKSASISLLVNTTSNAVMSCSSSGRHRNRVWTMAILVMA